jgi:hypothetical protein
MTFFTQNATNYTEKVIVTLRNEENYHFSPKIGNKRKNSDHNIDPRFCNELAKFSRKKNHPLVTSDRRR